MRCYACVGANRLPHACPRQARTQCLPLNAAGFHEGDGGCCRGSLVTSGLRQNSPRPQARKSPPPSPISPAAPTVLTEDSRPRTWDEVPCAPSHAGKSPDAANEMQEITFRFSTTPRRVSLSPWGFDTSGPNPAGTNRRRREIVSRSIRRILIVLPSDADLALASGRPYEAMHLCGPGAQASWPKREARRFCSRPVGTVRGWYSSGRRVLIHLAPVQFSRRAGARSATTMSSPALPVSARMRP